MTAELLTSPEAQALLATLGPADLANTLATQTRLRRQGHPPLLVSAVLHQVELRVAAAAKLGPSAARMLLTRDGVEQATRPDIAAEHAARFVTAGIEQVYDLGCGLGLDAIALLAAGLSVHAVEADPATAALAAYNLSSSSRAVVHVQRAEEMSVPSGAGCWLDPARRIPGVADIRGRTRRTFSLDELSPSWATVQQVAATHPATGAKLSPLFPRAQVPVGAEAWWTSWNGAVVECTLWWGMLARQPGRGAVIWRHGQRYTVTEDDLPSTQELPDATTSIPVLPDGDGSMPAGTLWLHEADRAVIAAGLSGTLARTTQGRELETGLGYVISDQSDTPGWARSYQILASAPLHAKAVRRICRSRHATPTTIKQRGVNVVEARFRTEVGLPTKGGDGTALVLTRADGHPVALLVAPQA